MNVLVGGKNTKGIDSSGCWKAHMSFGSAELLRKRIPSYTRLGIREGIEG
jgi:hypothetical protein